MAQVHVVFPAAGVGKRFGSAEPKQYTTIYDRTVMEWTLDAFTAVEGLSKKIIALQPDDIKGREIASRAGVTDVCVGGNERADSVLNALTLLAVTESADDWVLVHDIARPCVRATDVQTLIQECEQLDQGGVLARPITDTVKQVGSVPGQCKTLNRSELWTVQTPQCFRLGELLTAMRYCAASNIPVTDESSAIEATGGAMHLVTGSADNIKLTHAEDASLVAHYLAQQERIK